jgi:hypothetical protein
MFHLNLVPGTRLESCLKHLGSASLLRISKALRRGAGSTRLKAACTRRRLSEVADVDLSTPNVRDDASDCDGYEAVR